MTLLLLSALRSFLKVSIRRTRCGFRSVSGIGAIGAPFSAAHLVTQ